MRFLKSFLEEAERQNTTPKEPPKLTEPPAGSIDTTQEELTKPPEPSSVSFVGTYPPVYGRKLTNEDRREVEKWADCSPGITVDNVLRVFPGAKVIYLTDERKTDVCKRCGANRYAKIVRRTWRNGRSHWMCHRCGREVKTDD